MFGVFDGFRYRSEVTIEIHAILKLVPELKNVLNHFVPNLNDRISYLRKEQTPALVAAACISLVLIEKIIEPVSPETRMLALQYLSANADDGFQQFAAYYAALSNNQTLEHPAGMPNLAPVLSFACWYLASAFSQHKLSKE
jgi:hypothetical protein